MSTAAEFVDAALQYESTGERAESDRYTIGADSDLGFYGASVGAIRASIRAVAKRHRAEYHRDLEHDEITALASELWGAPVFERRLAAIVLLQSHVGLLRHGDLTRLEGFLRTSEVPELLHPLVDDVVRPLISGLEPGARRHADVVLARWATDGDEALAHAASTVV